MKSIAFWSTTPQQGKTTAARFLIDNHDYVKISFADPLRFMLERLLNSDTALREFDEWDHIIVNNGTVEQLCSQVRRLIA